MTDVTTFAGLTVHTRQCTKWELTAQSFDCTFDCVTTSYADYAALAALKGSASVRRALLLCGEISNQGNGTGGTLVVNGVSFTNCKITELSAAEAAGTALQTWNYTVSFSQDTTS